MIMNEILILILNFHKIKLYNEVRKILTTDKLLCTTSHYFSVLPYKHWLKATDINPFQH